MDFVTSEHFLLFYLRQLTQTLRAPPLQSLSQEVTQVSWAVSCSHWHVSSPLSCWCSGHFIKWDADERGSTASHLAGRSDRECLTRQITVGSHPPGVQLL